MQNKEQLNLPPLNLPPAYDDNSNQGPAIVLAGPTGYVPYQAGPQESNRMPTQMDMNIPYQQPLPPPTQYQPGCQVNTMENDYPLYRAQLVFGLINAIIFFPLFFFWVPALVYAYNSRSYYLAYNYKKANYCAKSAKGINIGCVVFGVILYILLMIVLPIVLSDKDEDEDSSEFWHSSSCSSSPYHNYYICDIYKRGCRWRNTYDFRNHYTYWHYAWKCKHSWY